MKWVLRQDGILIIADPHIPNNPLRFFLNLIMQFSNSEDVKIYSKNEMKELLEKRGFTLIKWKSKGAHWEKYFIATAVSTA